MRKIMVISMVLSLSLFAGTAMALTITATGDGNTLVNNILGAGITTTNISYTGSALASGTFTDGIASGLGFESGIVLTSGWATDTDGPNSNGNTHETLGGGGAGDDTSRDLGLSGDPDLTTLSGFSTFDATILEFDFTTTGGALYFNFVFGSEEYIDFVNTSYNDVFGFFVDGINIGLVPGTSSPITINTVNPLTNPAYYVNNIDPSGYDIEYDGFTTVIGASILALNAGDTHHMKFAIADASDHILDSGVFIQAGSFSHNPTNPVPEPATMLLLGTGLIGLAGFRKRAKK